MQILKNREDYFNYPALNYSALKNLDSDPESLIAKDKDFSDGLAFGDAVDCLIYDGVDAFLKKFYKFHAQKLTSSLEVLADAYIDLMKTQKMTSRDVELALSLSDKLGLWSNVKDKAKRETKFTEDFWAYLDAVEEAEGKYIIDPETYEKVTLAVHTLRTNSFTKNYYVESEGIELFTQVAMVFQLGLHKMKSMMDTICVNHTNKTVEPVDTKTMGENVYFFPGKIIKWRYDLQAELYREAVIQWANNNYPGYEVLPFKFIVVSSQRTDRPFIYKLDPLNFREKLNKNRIRPLRGLGQLIEEYLWHTKHQLFEYPKEMYQKGCIEL